MSGNSFSIEIWIGNFDDSSIVIEEKLVPKSENINDSVMRKE